MIAATNLYHQTPSKRLFVQWSKEKIFARRIFLALQTISKYSMSFTYFNIRNYPPKVIKDEKLNIILPRVNNFDIKEKLAWNICFII